MSFKLTRNLIRRLTKMKIYLIGIIYKIMIIRAKRRIKFMILLTAWICFNKKRNLKRTINGTAINAKKINLLLRKSIFTKLLITYISSLKDFKKLILLILQRLRIQSHSQLTILIYLTSYWIINFQMNV